MYGFVHRRDIVTSMVQAKEDSTLLRPFGEIPVFKNDWILTNVDGDQFTVSDEYVNAMKQIKVVTNPTRKMESPFVQEHIEQMMQACNLNQDESDLWKK